MAKTTKTPPVRKPVKARGALPQPKVAPKRTSTVWHKRLGFRIVGAIVLLVVLGIALKLGLDFRERAETRREQAREVRLFENSVQLLQSGAGDSLVAASKSPAEFTAGTLPPEEFKKQTDAWLASFRKLDEGLRKREIPPNLPALEELRALYVQAAVGYIDATKIFQLAAGLSDPGRAEAVKQANNVLSHANSIAALGSRQLDKLKRRFDLIDDAAGTSSPPAIQLPSEEAPPPGAGQPAGGGVPGQATGIPGAPGGPGASVPGGIPGVPGVPGQPPG